MLGTLHLLCIRASESPASPVSAGTAKIVLVGSCVFVNVLAYKRGYCGYHMGNAYRRSAPWEQRNQSCECGLCRMLMRWCRTRQLNM